MLALRVVVRPVYDPALIVIFIDTCKEHYVTHSQRFNTWSDVDIMSH